ncbi:MAG: hypothetical protein HY234_08995 [Acidobacteria bacterium]|nr:hypothetical protein [Acidobacteriota bacterium]MBI3663170.1 hypothetical protein [Acidobacteriota bacterium]
MRFFKCRYFRCLLALALGFLLLFAGGAAAQQSAPGNAMEIYAALKKAELVSLMRAENVVLKRDRGEMTFNGMFYFGAPIGGKVRSAVFIGKGTFRAEPPASLFERENLQRLLKADKVESDFQTAVLRFTDDTYEMLAKGAPPSGGATPEAMKLAAGFEPRMLKETGANISARQLVSIANQETPGFFVAQFDKGERGRFTLLLDYQTRMPVANFDINGGEKGLIFAYRKEMFGNDVWLAFYSLEDYQKRIVSYSDAFDLIAISKFTMNADVREPRKTLRLTVGMDMVSAVDHLRVIPLVINEGLSEYDNDRLKKAMRVKSASLGGGPLDVIQEDWEAGLTLVLPAARKADEKFSAELFLEGNFLRDEAGNVILRGFSVVSLPDCLYLRSNTSWYPRHGYLKRSIFQMTFHHRKQYRIATVGTRVREEFAGENKSEMVTEYRMDHRVAFVTFAMGPFERYAEKAKLQQGGAEIPIEFNSLSGSVMPIKEDFIVAEMTNALNFFSVMFGAYPYPTFSATFHPFGFGQGFPTMLMIPPTDRASKYTYVFVAHETAHQWWGNVVAWRSYRDQWLSEGFAEYSGLLYTARRDRYSSQVELMKWMRDQLNAPPGTELGIGKGRVTDIGPLILGQRLFTRESVNAYYVLTYYKGALVLRMLHFLFTNPSTGDGQPFFDMMSDFVKRHKDGWATTESFMQVASEHFVRTPRQRAERLVHGAAAGGELRQGQERARDGVRAGHADAVQH